MSVRIFARALGALLIALSVLAVTAQEPPAPPAKPAGAPADKEKEKEKDFPDFDTVVKKEFEKREGFITLYYNAKTDQLLAGIPRDLLNKEFLLATSISAGGMRGFQTADWLLKFEQSDKTLLIVAPETRFTAEGALEQVVNQTYPDAVVAQVPILTMSPDGQFIIDMKGLLSSNSSLLSGGFIYSYFMGSARPSVNVVKVNRAKAFPDNNEIALEFRGFETSAMHFSLARLRSSKGFEPRAADQRVGYFMTSRVNFSRDERDDTVMDRYINRWNVAKADKALKLSPPAEPIIFYIEDSVPVKYRRYVAEGILMWNKAYEDVGITGAIQVRQQTDANEFKDLDPEDARYNFFRWITSGMAFAMGPSRVNPRTGEILDADIIFDESMLRSWLKGHDLLVGSINDPKMSARTRQYLARHPQEHPLFNELQTQLGMMAAEAGTIESLSAERMIAESMLAHQGGSCSSRLCLIGNDLAGQMAFAQLIIQADLASEPAAGETEEKKKEESGEATSSTLAEASSSTSSTTETAAATDEKKEEEKGAAVNADNEKKDIEKKDEKKGLLDEWPEELVGQMVRMVVAHEVGHTLGLRHNFKASSWKTLEEIVNNEDQNVPTSASVMDYLPFNTKPDGSLPKQWTTPTIGPYDRWAIQYGYATPGANDQPADAKEMLKKIASRSGEPGLAYLTDEDLAAPDPLQNLWDLGSDTLTYARQQLELTRNVEAKILDKLVRDGESYDKARRAYRTLLGYRARAAYVAAYYVGGHYITRDQKGSPDAKPPITVVEAEKQREALKLVVESIFARDAFKIDPKLQQYLAASRWADMGYYNWGESLTYPVQDDVMRIQKMILFFLMSPDTISNLYDSEFRVSPETDLLTVPELMQTLTAAIFDELDATAPGAAFTTRKPMVDSLRRNLQRRYLGELIKMAIRDEDSWYPAISRTLAARELRLLNEKLGNVIKRDQAMLDAYTIAHFEESQQRITKALDAGFTINAGGGANPFWFLLFGQPGSDAGAPQGTMRMPKPNMGSAVHPLFLQQLEEKRDGF